MEPGRAVARYRSGASERAASYYSISWGGGGYLGETRHEKRCSVDHPHFRRSAGPRHPGELVISCQLSALSKTRGGGRPCPLRMKNRWRGRLSRGSRRGLNLLIQHRLSVFSQQARRFGVYIGGSDEAGSPVLEQNGLCKMKGDENKTIRSRLGTRNFDVVGLGVVALDGIICANRDRGVGAGRSAGAAGVCAAALSWSGLFLDSGLLGVG